MNILIFALVTFQVKPISGDYVDESLASCVVAQFYICIYA